MTKGDVAIELESREVADLLLKDLYGEEFGYPALMDCIDRNAEGGSGAAVKIEKESASKQLAVLAVHAEYGGTSVTGSDTLESIYEGRWRYRVLIPSPRNGILEGHSSSYFGGIIHNRMPLTIVGGTSLLMTHDFAKIQRFRQRYLATARQASHDLLTLFSI